MGLSNRCGLLPGAFHKVDITGLEIGCIITCDPILTGTRAYLRNGFRHSIARVGACAPLWQAHDHVGPEALSVPKIPSNDALIGMIMGILHCVWLGLRMAKAGWQYGHGQCPILRPNLRRRSERNIRMAVL